MPINQIEQPNTGSQVDGSKIMPTGEGNSIPNQYMVESTTAFQNVANLSAFDFMEQTYNGSHGYRDRRYLIPSIREAFYERRRAMSYYVNVLKPIIDAMVDPVFTATIERKHNGNAYVDKFIENSDNAGTPLTTIIKNAITTARLCSISFIVVDNFKQGEISQVENDNIQNRKFPYIYQKTAQEVEAWTTNDQGGLTSITFCEKVEKVAGGEGAAIERHYYRYWDSMMWKEYYIDNPAIKKDAVPVDVGEGTHGLGIVPVIPVLNFARTASMKTLPTPELYNLAFLCFALFQKESLVVMGELYQTSSLLYVSNWGKTGLNAGATNFIDCGPDAKFPPGYAAPPQEGLKTVISNCERLKEEIRNEAKQSGVIGLKEAKSGLAKEWDFRAEEIVLRESAMAAIELEKKIVAIVEKYVKSDFGYTVRYETNYSPNADAIRIERMLQILDRVQSGPLNLASQKEIVAIEWKSQPQKVEEVLEEMDSDKDEKDAIGRMLKEEQDAAEAKAQRAAMEMENKKGGELA